MALFVFNRPETTRRVFAAVAAVQPSRLLLIADGPRGDRGGDAEACARVREIVAEVGWPCEVSALFAETNMGCDARIVSGLDWVFSMVDEAIVLEDDCLPDASFFPFCEEMLERYRDDARVAAICGTNLVAESVKGEASYFFSQLGGNWGWATWRKEWERFDHTMDEWPALKRDGVLAEVFDDARMVAF
ncbi:MAG: glycosyltransferase family 2 protein, partial [Acidobacteriota bacterium]